jgi:hypothetical protein
MLRSGIPVSLIFAALTLFAADAAPKGLTWQTGEIVSMKEDASDRDGKWTSFVYGVRGKDRTYAVVTSAPLKAYIHTTVKFGVDKTLLYIQDLDGKTRKSCIL